MFHVKHRCNLRKQRVKFVKCIYVILIAWIMNMSKDHVQKKRMKVATANEKYKDNQR